MAVWKNDYIGFNPYSRSGKKMTAQRKGVIHYTANHGATARNHHNYFKNLNGRYASAHIFVDKHEAICIIPLNEVAYHANDGSYRGIPELKPNANYLSVGVEMCQEKDGSIHPDTIARTEDVFVELSKIYGWNPEKDIVRHYDITRKNCPAPWVSNGNLFSDFKKRVKAKLDGKQVSKPVATKPITVQSTASSKPKWTKVTGNWTGQTLKEGQYGEPVKQLQTKLAKNDPPFYPNKGAKNNGIDSYYGQDTKDAVRRFQSYYGLSVDGLAGKQVYGKLNSTTTTKKTSSAQPKANLKVDGVWGNGTTKAIQKVLKTPIDGIISNQPNNSVTKQIIGVKFGSGSSPMVKALQKKIGATQDGRIGSDTIRKLQKYLGTVQDGKLSRPSLVVKELQRRLNKDTF